MTRKGRSYVGLFNLKHIRSIEYEKNVEDGKVTMYYDDNDSIEMNDEEQNKIIKRFIDTFPVSKVSFFNEWNKKQQQLEQEQEQAKVKLEQTVQSASTDKPTPERKFPKYNYQ